MLNRRRPDLRLDIRHEAMPVYCQTICPPAPNCADDRALLVRSLKSMPTKKELRSLAISDLHLPDGRCDELRLLATLNQLLPQVRERVLLLGDIAEAYLCPETAGRQAASKLIATILGKTAPNVTVHVVVGNHDDRIWRSWEHSIVQIHSGELILDNGHLVCVHGHNWDPASWLYRGLKTFGYRGSYAVGRILEKFSPHGSRREDVRPYRQAATRRAKRMPPGSTLIHGHTHRPGTFGVGRVHVIDLGAGFDGCLATETLAGTWTLTNARDPTPGN